MELKFEHYSATLTMMNTHNSQTELIRAVFVFGLAYSRLVAATTLKFREENSKIS